MTAFLPGPLPMPASTPQERGQKLLDLYASNLQAQATAAGEANAAAWQELMMSGAPPPWPSPELAGKAEAEIGAVKQGLLARGATPSTSFKALDLTGAGNNPHAWANLRSDFAVSGRETDRWRGQPARYRRRQGGKDVSHHENPGVRNVLLSRNWQQPDAS